MALEHARYVLLALAPAKVLSSSAHQTDFQVCFSNPQILTKETQYLVVRGKTASGLYGVWHFDDDVRY